jgi:hypothetical protein
MPLLRRFPAGRLIDHGPYLSPFPAESRYAAARNGDRGHALGLPEERAGAQLCNLLWTPARTSASLSARQRFNCDRSEP